MHSHLGHALAAQLSRTQETTTALAQRAGVTQSTISRLALASRRIDIDTLRALCTSQPNPRDGLELLIAHLRDEIDRAGRGQSELTISHDDRSLEPDIRLLEIEARKDAELFALLARLASLCRARPLANYPAEAPDSDLRAAED